MPHGFEVTFETAWSPPEEVCNAIRDQYDDLSIVGSMMNQVAKLRGIYNPLTDDELQTVINLVDARLDSSIMKSIKNTRQTNRISMEAVWIVNYC